MVDGQSRVGGLHTLHHQWGGFKVYSSLRPRVSWQSKLQGHAWLMPFFSLLSLLILFPWSLLMFLGINFQINNMSQGLFLGGPKLRQHYSSYLIFSVKLNQLIIMRTLKQQIFPNWLLYIFTIASNLYSSSELTPQEKTKQKTKKWGRYWIIHHWVDRKIEVWGWYITTAHDFTCNAKKEIHPHLCDSKTPAQCYLAFIRSSYLAFIRSSLCKLFGS